MMPGCAFTVRLSSSSGPSKMMLERDTPSASSTSSMTALAAADSR